MFGRQASDLPPDVDLNEFYTVSHNQRRPIATNNCIHDQLRMDFTSSYGYALVVVMLLAESNSFTQPASVQVTERTIHFSGESTCEPNGNT